ncbi:MAG: hypothetical protein WBC13_05210, partial [Dokdonella sp.]
MASAAQAPCPLIPFMVPQAHHERIPLDPRCLKYASQLDRTDGRNAWHDSGASSASRGLPFAGRTNEQSLASAEIQSE